MKEFIAALGANVTPDAVVKLGKSLGPLYAFVENYLQGMKDGDEDVGRHSPAKQEADVKAMVQQLVDEGQVLTKKQKRKQKSNKLYTSLLHKHSAVDIRKWLKRISKDILLSN